MCWECCGIRKATEISICNQISLLDNNHIEFTANPIWYSNKKRFPNANFTSTVNKIKSKVCYR